MSAAAPTRVWVTYIVHAQREGERYPWRKCGRTQTVTVDAGDVDQAFAIGSSQVGQQLAQRGKGRGGRKS